MTQARYPDREALLAALFPEQKGTSHPIFHNLPQPDYTSFVGRQEEVDWLRQRLSPRDRAWQIVLSGIGGVGKSALALFIAFYYYKHYYELSAEERFEAIIWTSAKEEVLTVHGRRKAAPSGLISRTLQDIYTAVAQTLNREDITRAASPEVQDRLVQKALSSQRTLLIVDNLESIVDEQVHAFLYRVPEPTKCLITSREWVDVAVIQKLKGLPFEAADKMITEEAETRGVHLGQTQRLRLFERTFGLPLPIRLSIARLDSGETFAQVMHWLGNATGDLPEYCIKNQINAAHRQHSGSLVLLFTCSLFDRGTGACREAISYISNLSLTDCDEALALLQRLSLLNRTQEDRFWVLPMVQKYVESQYADADFHQGLTQRWLDWLLEFIQRYGIDLVEHGIDLEGRTDRIQFIAIEYANVLSAIRWCHKHGELKSLIHLAEGIWAYPNLVGLLSELREILEDAVQAAEAIQYERHAGRFLLRLGKLSWEQGQNEIALEHVKKAKATALQYADEMELGRVEDIHIAILTSLGQLEQARESAETLLQIGERFNNSELKHLATFRLSRIHFKQQQFDKALAWSYQSEQWCKELGWSQRLAWILHGRADILAQQGKVDVAESLLKKSLSIAISWNERGLIASNKVGLAQLYKNTGRLALAAQLATEARDVFERLGWRKEHQGAETFLAHMND